jgi:hypothetical protein
VEMAKEKGWQRCYSCKAVVELKEGCNHMTWYVSKQVTRIHHKISNSVQPLHSTILHGLRRPLENLQLPMVQLPTHPRRRPPKRHARPLPPTSTLRRRRSH